MLLPRPRTFLNLVVVGFVLVSLPLTVGLFSTFSYLDKLSNRSVLIVESTKGGVKNSNDLSSILRNIERHLRLYEIVSAGEQLQTAIGYYQESTGFMEKLLGLPIAGELRKEMLELQNMQQAFGRQLILLQNEEKRKTVSLESLLNLLHQIRDRAATIGNGVTGWVEEEVGLLTELVKKAQGTLTNQTIGFILLTILMIFGFAVLISWPIRQLNKSVERLGAGDFTTPVFVVGPKDIELVGKKLEWLRNRLAYLEQEKTKFLAHVSHELKTPLASIREGASLLSEEVVGNLDENQRQVAAILVNNSIKLQQLIDNILKINMAKVGRKEVQQEMVPLHQVIEMVAEEQTNKVLSKKLKLKLELTDVLISGNKKELEDLFENLFSNAVKFSPVSGIISCAMKLSDKQIHILISDQGPGIPESEQQKIFSAYHRIEDEAHGHEDGSGLGLAIVKEYVKNHGGSVEVVQNNTAGTSFLVILPLDREEAEV